MLSSMFFFKQKTAYEMRISDWSSDVCSSDLAKLERLVRERDGMGPVNLRAEAEVAELEQQIQGMQTEREDLVAAIARLRQGIGALNREGRERLLAAFDRSEEHTSELQSLLRNSYAVFCLKKKKEQQPREP